MIVSFFSAIRGGRMVIFQFSGFYCTIFDYAIICTVRHYYTRKGAALNTAGRIPK